MAALATVGTGSAAGCVGQIRDPGGGSSAPAYADPLYDPSAVMDARTSAFVSYDLGTIYEHRDLLPESVATRIEEFDGQYDSVSIADLGLFTGQVYTTGALGDLSGGSVTAGGSAVLEGSFEPDQLLSQLRALGAVDVEAAGTSGDHDLYTVTKPPTLPSTTLALDGKRVAVGATHQADVTGETAVTTALDAEGGGSAYYRSSDVGRRLVDGLGDVTTATGIVAGIGSYARENTQSYPTADLEAAATGLQGIGSGTTIEGETITSTIAGVYEDGEVPSDAEVSGVVDWVKEQASGHPGAKLPDEIRTSVDGRTVTASYDIDPSALFEDGPTGPGPGPGAVAASPLAALMGTFVLGIGRVGSPPSVDENPPADSDDRGAPQVSLDWSYGPEQTPTLQAVHNGGDTLRAPNLRATVPDGEGTVTLKKGPTFSAGDQIIAESTGLSAGATVRLLWQPPDESGAAILGSFTVP